MKYLKSCILFLISLIIVFSLASCKEVGAGHKNKDTVLKAGDRKVTYDEYRYFYMNYKTDDPEATEDELHELVCEAISSNVAITLLAKNYDVKLDSQSNDALDSYIKGLIEEKGGEEEYFNYLSNNYLTGDVFRYLYSQKLLEEKLREHILDEANGIIDSDDESFEADLEKNFMAAKQILICNDEGDDPNDNRELANSLLDRLNQGEEFDILLAEYSEDKDSDPEHGRYFTKGMMLPEFEKSVLSLEEGEIGSAVVESNIGYHIIKRLPLDEEYINNNYETLRYYFKTRVFNELLQEKKQSVVLEKTDNFNELDFMS